MLAIESYVCLKENWDDEEEEESKEKPGTTENVTGRTYLITLSALINKFSITLCPVHVVGSNQGSLF